LKPGSTHAPVIRYLGAYRKIEALNSKPLQPKIGGLNVKNNSPVRAKSGFKPSDFKITTNYLSAFRIAYWRTIAHILHDKGSKNVY
jgi:hypothetical protein